VRGNRLNRWLSALLLAPLLALAVSASSFSALRCTMSGLFVPDAGCTMLDEAAQPATQATLGAPACCERVVVAMAKAPAASSLRAQLAPPHVHVLSAVILQPPPTSVPRTARFDLASAAHGRASPVFLLTQSFLI
jgi:hypothetical protein